MTSREEVADRSRLLRNYGQRENYASEIPGDNSRLDEIHAAILRVKLKKLEAWNRRRRAIAASYRAGIGELPVGMQAETGQSNYHLFVVTTPERDALRRHLASLEIPSLVHYPIPLPRQKAFAEFNPAKCPACGSVVFASAEPADASVSGGLRSGEGHFRSAERSLRSDWTGERSSSGNERMYRIPLLIRRELIAKRSGVVPKPQLYGGGSGTTSRG